MKFGCGVLAVAVVLLQPLIVRAERDGPTWSAPGPLLRAALEEAAAFQASAPEPAKQGPRADWSRVTRMKGGQRITLTASGLGSADRHLLRADAEGLIVLNTSNPSLPGDVRKSLQDAVPAYLLNVRNGRTLQLPRKVTVSPAGVFQADRQVASLTDVIVNVPRSQVREIRIRRKHIGDHAFRGVMIGAGIGAAIAGSSAASCDSGREEGYCEVLPMMGAGALFGGLLGLEFGTIIGVIAPRSADVIYRID